MNEKHKVILCCIKTQKDKTGFSAENFRNFASSFGNVDKIVIFSRKAIVKLFVSYVFDGLNPNIF